jgi:hypothetical protein
MDGGDARVSHSPLTAPAPSELLLWAFNASAGRAKEGGANACQQRKLPVLIVLLENLSTSRLRAWVTRRRAGAKWRLQRRSDPHTCPRAFLSFSAPGYGDYLGPLQVQYSSKFPQPRVPLLNRALPLEWIGVDLPPCGGSTPPLSTLQYMVGP